MEDCEIISLLNKRQEEGLREIRKKYGRFCSFLAGRLLDSREDVEECISDTLLAAWNQIPPDQPDSLQAYLGRIIRNLSVSRFRALEAGKRAGKLTCLLSELNESVPELTADKEEALDLRDCLNHWLRSLHPQDRRLFLRRYWYAESVQELARELGLSPNTTAQRLLRLRRQLKRALEQKGILL